MLQIHNQSPLEDDYKTEGAAGGNQEGGGTISVSVSCNQAAGNSYC